MLHFFYTYHQLPEIKTPAATTFQISSAGQFRHKIIPFSHLYITSNPYFRKIKKSLDEDAEKLKTMNQAQIDAICADKRFPVELKSLGLSTVEHIKTQYAELEEINVIVVNGIGTGFGDNYVGLGAMQRLQALLMPITVNFHLMQNMNERVAPVYMREPNVFLLNNCVDLKKFMQMDFYVNLTGMLGFPEFESMPLANFMADSFKVKELSSIEQLQPELKLDPFKLKSIDDAIKQEFDKSQLKQPLVLFHPKASSPVRTIIKAVADALITALIAHGFRAISAIPYDFNAQNAEGFRSLDHISSDVDDLLHITACCDAVISVGTVLYHLAAALDKPTILLPSVKADVESGNVLPNVHTWVPKESSILIINKHKSREEEDLKIAEQIWQNIDPSELSQALMDMLKESKK